MMDDTDLNPPFDCYLKRKTRPHRVHVDRHPHCAARLFVVRTVAGAPHVHIIIVIIFVAAVRPARPTASVTVMFCSCSVNEDRPNLRLRPLGNNPKRARD